MSEPSLNGALAPQNNNIITLRLLRSKNSTKTLFYYLLWQHFWSRDFSLVLQTVSGVCLVIKSRVFGWFSLEFLFKVSKYDKQNGKITMFQFRCGAYSWLWNACMYDEIVPCSVTSDMTPFYSWMPITKFINNFLVSVVFWNIIIKSCSLKNALASFLVECPIFVLDFIAPAIIAWPNGRYQVRIFCMTPPLEAFSTNGLILLNYKSTVWFYTYVLYSKHPHIVPFPTPFLFMIISLPKVLPTSCK